MRTFAPMLLACVAAIPSAHAQDRIAGPAERATIEALERIETIDPKINSVLAVDPTALDQARHVDRIRRAPTALTGVPVLLKDNIEAKGPLPTTAGSLALRNNVTDRDSPLVAGLRSAGAVILGKTNLSEWANFRSESSNSGWSALGGQTYNPYALDRSPCGSSSGSGAAVAAGIVDIAIGTETNGSVTCPAAMNGIVGLKPTVGMVSRTHIVPISVTQDTAGPMTRTVFQAAAVMDAIAGSDPADPATADADRYAGTFLTALDGASLEGVRLGVLEFATGFGTDEAFAAAKAQLERQGAILVPIKEIGAEPLEGGISYNILLTEFKDGINDYLATTPDAVTARTLADLIEFNKASDRELAVFDQSIFIKSQETDIEDPDYVEGVKANVQWSGPDGIDRMLEEHDVVALIFPTAAPSMLIDHVHGDSWHGGGAGYLAAWSGYPHLTVPMGMAKGLPVGLSFVGTKWDDARLLALGHAYEEARPALPAPQFYDSVMDTPELAPLLAKAD
ncbi:amidase [Sphingomicrobium clamense]|uniref:Amidase n=1 Tax=Sphingomicrobium clamense TaxID=2851013 RepID=A0ABS6V2Q5_9SPHN|nr:amidase [Sphingomicrobium sp. B8]MBW0143837.1 amidase [Sphingomicrobium sp. B8]